MKSKNNNQKGAMNLERLAGFAVFGRDSEEANRRTMPTVRPNSARTSWHRVSSKIFDDPFFSSGDFLERNSRMVHFGVELRIHFA